MKKKKKIVFIISNGRSGSTILSKFLGMHSHCFALSEPSHFDIEIKKNGYCSCEESISDCAFWGKIIRDIEIEQKIPISNFNTSQKPFHISHKRIGKIASYLHLCVFQLTAKELFRSPYLEQAKNECLLLRTVANNTNEHVILDASKSFPRALYIKKLLRKEFNTGFILLFRTPEETIYSNLKTSYTFKLKGETINLKKDTAKELSHITEEWRKVTKNILRLSSIFRLKPQSIILYEEFAQSPRKAFERLSRTLGLSWEEGMEDLSQSGHHMISGNYSRIKAKSILPPKNDSRNLPKEDLDYIKRETRSTMRKITKLNHKNAQ
ncbi:sulfotransferase [Coraliomargarita sp. SDUM461004]|uniref:Sulfotransferase n=1 Tax=Thalassobacterium sedimentorum TaxID=3041258 RepID=A0ABU1APZ9_9BACT|nr:sulfotransferase [Coraliomargarita sp. SDUM461004]MDQ8195940.1 sulfotransferase [Coraliomargarita sp. SDUM461004]